jgi:hypothetical protein
VKSAYERALEKLDATGIERPHSDALTQEVKEKMAEVRGRAEAKIAELEILHRKSLGKIGDPHARRTEEEEYASERRRIEEKRDRDLAELRGS